jgi:hypothetical protein
MGQAVSGTARVGRKRWRGPASLLAGLIVVASAAATAQSGPLAGFTSVTVGQITVLAKPAELNVAVALAERADQPRAWYGLGRREIGPVTLIVVRGQSTFDAMSRGRAPRWGAGWALPTARFVVVRVDGDDAFRVLQHELAHIVLHQAIRGRVPLWFDEGYAVLAAGEFSRFEQLGLNLTVARGAIPSLDELNNGLRGSESTAETAYALAGSVVSFMANRTPTRSIEPLLKRLGDGVPFDSAVEVSTGLNPGRFEETWQKDMKRRYGLGLWFVAGGMWSIVAGLVVVAHLIRRRRDRPRRAQLDVGWDVPTSDEEEGPPLDRE